MKYRPILFSGPMVRAIREERKTQTRRLIKPQPKHDPSSSMPWVDDGPTPSGAGRIGHSLTLDECPYGVRGDRLIVRETHYRFGHWEPATSRKPRKRPFRQRWQFVPDTDEVRFDPPESFRKGRHKEDPATPAWHKRSSLFMPNAVHRITLKVTGVRVERVEDITEDDARAEGFARFKWDESKEPWRWRAMTKDEERKRPIKGTARDAFLHTFYDLNKRTPRGSNPWVWVVNFKPVKGTT